MKPADVAREKFQHLIALVEELEDQIAALEAQPAAPARNEQLLKKQEELANARRELQVASDGCGRPRPC